jgi:hypothetical protein
LAEIEIKKSYLAGEADVANLSHFLSARGCQWFNVSSSAIFANFRQSSAIFANFRQFSPISPIFCDFRQFSAKNFALFLKTNVVTIVYAFIAPLTLIENANFFRRKYFKNHNIGPLCGSIQPQAGLKPGK